MLMHILYIYYTHISTLFHQTNCYNQNGDRPWGKGGGGFFFFPRRRCLYQRV